MSQLGMQHSDGDVTLVPEIVREVHRGHPPRAKLALEAVAVGQSGREPG